MDQDESELKKLHNLVYGVGGLINDYAPFPTHDRAVQNGLVSLGEFVGNEQDRETGKLMPSVYEYKSIMFASSMLINVLFTADPDLVNGLPPIYEMIGGIGKPGAEIKSVTRAVAHWAAVSGNHDLPTADRSAAKIGAIRATVGYLENHAPQGVAHAVKNRLRFVFYEAYNDQLFTGDYLDILDIYSLEKSPMKQEMMDRYIKAQQDVVIQGIGLQALPKKFVIDHLSISSRGLSVSNRGLSSWAINTMLNDGIYLQKKGD